MLGKKKKKTSLVIFNSDLLWSFSELGGVKSYSGKLLWQCGDLVSIFPYW